jgi:DNA polymerase III subunit gamma/tau
MMKRMAKRKSTAETTALALAENAEPASAPSKDYTVLARRYRPQQFADLVGQEPVAQALANALQTGRVAHAYLFTGARGVGKTSAARILAKALNCEKGPTTTPCGECAMCQAIAAGEDTDVLEIDGASNTGVDDVREIRQNVQYSPARGRYKIYIIDEVHMLSKAAFNALLKTLEEPPPHVKFIFATTEAQKIPITILSRCQRFDFGGISLPRIVERLRQIVAGEGMQADDAALDFVARRAGGSMRDGQSLLDQLLAFSAERLTMDTIHQLLGTAHEDRVAALAGAVLQKDAKGALAVLADLVNQGQQLGEVLDQLIEYWRDLMVVRCAGVEGQDLSVSGAHLPSLRRQADALGLDTILAGPDLLVGAKGRLRGSSHMRVILEMTLVRLAQLEDLVALSQLVQWLDKEGTPPARTVGATGSGISHPARSLAASPINADSEKKKVDPAAGSCAVNVPSMSFSEESLPAIWQQIVCQAGFALASDLRKVANTAIFAPNTLVMRVPARYNPLGSNAIAPGSLTQIEALLSKTVGQTCTVRVETIREEPAAAQSASAGGPNNSAAGTRQAREKARQLPLVQKARDVLGAEILHVDPDFGEVVLPVKPADDSAIDLAVEAEEE